MGHVWTAPAVQEKLDYGGAFGRRQIRLSAAVPPLALSDPLIGPNQKHALFLRVARYGFSDRRSRPFRINVFITPAVRERALHPSSLPCRAP